MTEQDRWLLPEGIEELLPPRAARVEGLRRRLLDLYRGWGYELVTPPLIEYLESLLTGMGGDLDLQTFKLTDQLTGRLMGVRADITPQVARIDAHRLQREAPVRLCYLDRVLRTRPEEFGGSRSPLQVGAELYGHAGIESDVEILCLMLETLELTGVPDLHVDLGHVGIYRGLACAAGLNAEQEATLFDALQRKALPELGALLEGYGVRGAVRRGLAGLAEWNGGEECLDEAQAALRGVRHGVGEALAELRAIAAALRARRPGLPLYFDLAELRGYHYQTGVVFAAFTPRYGQEVARGGRYDGIGRVFGRARAATGFSADLHHLVALGSDESEAAAGGIFAPWGDGPALQARVHELRAAGERVVSVLPGQAGGAAEMGCDRRLVERDGEWYVEPL
jgi:ATP phosphoribosyltransferase regulatory subunit